MSEQWIPYYRISRPKKDKNGQPVRWGNELSLDVQRDAVRRLAESRSAVIVSDEYREIESGRNCDRPILKQALAHAKRIGAKVVVATLDRLTRDLRFWLDIRDSRTPTIFCDLPQLPDGPMGEFFLTIWVAFAEMESKMASLRNQKTTAQRKARGALIGAQDPRCRNLTPAAAAQGRKRAAERLQAVAREAYADLLPQIRAMWQSGYTLRRIANALNEAGHTTRTGKQWHPTTVRRVLIRARHASL